jgi:Fe-S-cluster containining protein
MSDNRNPWYGGEGLRFRCTRCGSCCRGAGNVWVSADEIAALAEKLRLADADFRSRYTRLSGRGSVLRHKRNQDCVFWSASSGCEVYEQRPRQCTTYPFWRGIVHSRDNWGDEARGCPGIGGGDLHPESEITQTAAADGIPVHRTRVRVEGS